MWDGLKIFKYEIGDVADFTHHSRYEETQLKKNKCLTEARQPPYC